MTLASCLDENGHPFPTFVSYATMSRLIDGAVYAGQADFGEGAYGYLFARGQDFVLAANCISGSREVTVDAGVPKVTIVDLMGRSKEVPDAGGQAETNAIAADAVCVAAPQQSPGL